MVFQRAIICVATLCVSISFGYYKFGWEFTTGSTSEIGCNFMMSRVIEIKPAFRLEKVSDGHGISPKVDVNWYVIRDQGLKQYVGTGVSAYSLLPNYEKKFVMNIHYGLRYDLNNFLSIFGEFGLKSNTHPNIESFSSGMGLTFFIPRKQIIGN